VNGRVLRLVARGEETGETETPAEVAHPVVYTDEQPRIVLQRILEVMKDANTPPVIFRRAGQLVGLTFHRNGEAPHIVPVSKHRLFKFLIEVADWRKKTAGDGASSSPPSRIMDALLEAPEQDIPELDDVTAVPMFGKDFEIITCPGYHEEQRLYFHDVHSLGAAASLRYDVIEARQLLLEAIQDFCFVEDADRAHAVALMVIPFIRMAIANAPTPLHLIESPSPGSGKGRLADLVSVIATGGPCKPVTMSGCATENRKRLTSLMMIGSPLILLDNVPQDRILDDAALVSVLTTTQPADRLLGGNQIVSLKNHAVWILTGNNVRSTLEIARRSVRIRIDARTDLPWLRNGFLHGDLLDWARRQRPRLVQACISLIRAWLDQGRPRWQGTPLGSFEEWSAVLGGILDVAQIPGFLENTERTYADADVETEEWRALTCLWWERFASVPVKASDLHSLCQQNELLAEVLGFGGVRSQVSRLGRALNRHVDRCFGELQIAQEQGVARSSARYILKRRERRVS
jgi:hypothetical protein